MASRGKAVVVVALIGLLLAGNYCFGQATAQPAEERAAPAPVTRPAGGVLSVVPADAWGVVGLNNLEQLDQEVMRLGQKLGLPIFFAPSGLIQMGLGITQGFDPAGGMALIVLDGTKYPGAANWSFFKGFPMPVVMALATSNDKELIQSLNGQPTEDPAVSTVTLQGEAVFAATKDGYVLVGPDAELLKSLLGKGAAATQPATAVLKPGFVKHMISSNLYIYVNGKPLLAAYGPVLKGMMAFVAAAMQGAQTGGDAAMMQLFPVLVNAYIDIMSKQLDRALIFAGLEPNGLHLSALVTFQPDTVLAKVFAAAKPSGRPLLAGLPDGAFVLAAGSEQTGQEYTQQLMDLFMKPYLDAMRASGIEALVAKVDQQVKLGEVRVQLTKLQKASQMGAYVLPKGENGVLGVVAASQFSDAAKAYELIKQNIKAQVDDAAAQQPKVKSFLEAVTYTEDAETIGGAKVHTLLADLTLLPKLLEVPEDKAAQAIKVIKMLFGSDGLKARIAVTDKSIVATLGGGDTFLKEALTAAKSAKAPLATQPAVAKVMDRLPKDRVSVFMVSAENLVQVVDKIAKAVGEDGLPFKAGQTSAPLAAAMIGDPLGLHVTLYVPTDLAVSVKGMYNQTQMQQKGAQPRGEAAPQSSGAPATAPAPEF
jgi:hypothetical protein